MAHEVKYRYRAYMPIDGTCKIVHIEALTPKLTYRLISFEYSRHGLCVLGVRTAPDDALHLAVDRTDERAIKMVLAMFQGHDEDHLEEIQIELHLDVALTVTGSDGPHRPLVRKLGSEIPHSSQYPASRRARRYGHGPDPDTRTRGWDPYD